jgi:Na+-transporting NADH:ubiquinone oxidoreductase subunit E
MDISAFVLFWAAIFTSNILLTNFLGMCSYLSVSREVESSFGLGVAVIFVLTVTAGLNWLVYHLILVPYNIVYLQYIVFIIVIAAFVQFLELEIERYAPALYYTLGIFLPLITLTCAIFG